MGSETEATKASAPGTDDVCGAPEELSGEELISKMQGVIEELLSKTSLEEDAFIKEHMSANMCVPICVLAGHRNIQCLGKGADVANLLIAAKRSDLLVVNEEDMLIKPRMKTRRNTLILHDLPEGIPEEELRELFKGAPGEDKLESVKPDVNRTAYVTFETDEDAQNVALWLRSQKLRGSMVKVAMKSQNFVRSFFPASIPPPVAAALSSPPMGPVGKGMMPPWMQPNPGKGKQAMWPGYGPAIPWQGYDGKGYEGSGYDASYDPSAFYGDGWQQPSEGMPESGPVKGKGEKGKGKGKKGKFAKGDFMKGDFMKGGSPPDGDLGQMDALPGAEQQDDMDFEGEDSMVDVGYEHEFRKYSRQQIIEVTSGMGEVAKPESYAKLEKEKGDLSLFRQSPYKDWAPLPTPMMSFASSVLEGGEGNGKGERRRPKGGGKGEDSGKGDGKGEDKEKGEEKEGQGEEKEGEWEEGGENGEGWGEWADDGSWAANARWNARQPRGKGGKRAAWPASSWYGSGPQWVEKGTAAKAEEEWKGEGTWEGEEGAWPANTRSSWADKVKAEARGQPASRWQAKVKKGEEGDAAASAPAATSAEAREASGEGPDKGAADEQPGATKGPSWADRARAAAEKPKTAAP
mmetsp:Transcript_44555/g.117742  ORF Transcript_44555/g.117742 Transcript_44555/m.117742 type:complete len:632 (+) Transcript_44555:152-2047(+)